MKYARIQNDLAVEVIYRNPQGFYHPLVAGQFEPVPDEVQVGAQRIDGVWVNPPEPEPLTEEQLAEIAARQTAYQREMSAQFLRSERNARLKACDWTQIEDCTVDKAAWKVYRQALRDVPQQAGFPESIDWPISPDGSENL